MGSTSSIIAWIAFGIMAGIVAMILPYHRGARGIFTNIALGVGGALAGGFVGRLLGLYPNVGSSEGFLLAVAGAVGVLAIFHTSFHASRRREAPAHNRTQVKR